MGTSKSKTSGNSTGNTTSNISGPKRLDGKAFIRQFVKAQTELLNGMLKCIHDGEIEIREDGADELVEQILGNWSSQEEPDLDSHMQASAAIFLWALLDQVYGDSVMEESGEVSTRNIGLELAFDVLKTVRAIWGKHGKNA